MPFYIVSNQKIPSRQHCIFKIQIWASPCVSPYLYFSRIITKAIFHSSWWISSSNYRFLCPKLLLSLATMSDSCLSETQLRWNFFVYTSTKTYIFSNGLINCLIKLYAPSFSIFTNLHCSLYDSLWLYSNVLYFDSCKNSESLYFSNRKWGIKLCVF